MLPSLLPPRRGRATIAGLDVGRTLPVCWSPGYLPRLTAADAQVTGFENLWALGGLYPFPRNKGRARIRERFELVAISRVSDDLLRSHSGMMVAQFEVSLALLHQPRGLVRIAVCARLYPRRAQ